MSFENPNGAHNKHEKKESSPKQGRIAHALASLTNGVLTRNMERSAQSGFLVAALEKAAETNQALAKFDPDGTLGATLEDGIRNLYDKLVNKPKGTQQS